MMRLLEPIEVITEIKQHPHPYIDLAFWEYDENHVYGVVIVSTDSKKLHNTVIKYILLNSEEDNPSDYVKQMQNLKARIKRRFKTSKVTSDLRY